MEVFRPYDPCKKFLKIDSQPSKIITIRYAGRPPLQPNLLVVCTKLAPSRLCVQDPVTLQYAAKLYHYVDSVCAFSAFFTPKMSQLSVAFFKEKLTPPLGYVIYERSLNWQEGDLTSFSWLNWQEGNLTSFSGLQLFFLAHFCSWHKNDGRTHPFMNRPVWAK